MIWNIRDSRKRPNRWKSVHAIVEPVQQDNGNEDADQAPLRDPENFHLFDERIGISVQEAVRWADELDASVTLFLRDVEH